MSCSARGFTLIEVLIALIIFAVAAMFVTARVSDTANQVYTLERRTLAHWVASNHLAQLSLAQQQSTEAIPTGRDRERRVMAGRDWILDVEVIDTAHPWFRRVEIRVFELIDGDEVGPVEFAEGFVGRY